jgi:hypothetical protein
MINIITTNMIDLFSFWPLCFLSFDLRILIIPLVSSNSSYVIYDVNDNDYSRVNVYFSCETLLILDLTFVLDVYSVKKTSE